MSIGIGGLSRRNINGAVDFVRAAERIGVDYCFSAEAWSQDAVTSIAYLAGKTEKIKLGTGIMQISARVPSMMAMTAMSLDDLSNGRFVLGLGASGPQVVEGFHGVPYKEPLTRLRESVDIIRLAFRGEKLIYHGKHFQLPLPGGEGKALRLDQQPRDIPIFLATLGPRALEYTGEVANGWLGTSFSPEHAEAHFSYLRKGAQKAGRSLEDLELQAACTVVIGENVEELITQRKAGVAFNLGGMGSATTNFYNDAFKRAGFVDDALAVQQLWLAGKREAAIARVPDELVTRFQAIGTADMVAERFRKYRDVGITSLGLRLDGVVGSERIELLEQIADLLRSMD